MNARLNRFGALLCSLIFALTIFAGCQDFAAPQIPLDITPHPTLAATPAPMPEPTPEPTPEPVPTPEPTPEPTPTPIPTPYQSEDYPLTPKSLRDHEGGRYPEEKRLNNDSDKFFAEVDLVNQVVLIFERDGDGEYTKLVREMICSSGAEPYSRSPRGTFRMGEDYKRFAYFVNHGVYGQYWAQISGRIYFHSVPYSERDDRFIIEEDFWSLGTASSHGCIRLMPDDAQWIYLYLCPGTVVCITDEKEPDPELVLKLLPKALPEPECYKIKTKKK